MTRDLWCLLGDSKAADYFSEFRKLATIMMLIPVSSAWAERCFSGMNHVKNAKRNGLKEGQLNATLRILYSRFETFPFTKALELFLAARPRRSVNGVEVADEEEDILNV